MWLGLLTDRINNKLEKSNLINEHALNREPVSLKVDYLDKAIWIKLGLLLFSFLKTEDLSIEWNSDEIYNKFVQWCWTNKAKRLPDESVYILIKNLTPKTNLTLCTLVTVYFWYRVIASYTLI